MIKCVKKLISFAPLFYTFSHLKRPLLENMFHFDNFGKF